VNENESPNVEPESLDGSAPNQDTNGAVPRAECACPHRGFRIALYSLVAFALLGNLAVRAAPEMTGAVTDFVQSQMLGVMGAPQACPSSSGSCCQSNFVYEGSDGLPCCGEMECTEESAQTESADPPPPTDLSEPSDGSGESELNDPSELTTLADETGELEIGVQR